MLAPDTLESLDSLIWFGSGEQAAHHCHCSQSAISRRATQAAARLGIKLKKCGNAWDTVPHSQLLRLERHVHQLYRFLKARRLRLDADHWAGQAILLDLPEAWISGPPGRIGIERPLHLLRERIIDAWISCTQADLPDQEDPHVIAFEIATMPLHIAGGSSHPLAGETGLSTNDLITYPSLGLHLECYPRFGQLLAQKGLWKDTISMDPYQFHDWEGRVTQSLATIPVNSLSTDLSQGLSVLDWPTGINDCLALIVRRDLCEQAEIQHLLDQLRRRAQAMARHNGELTVRL